MVTERSTYTSLKFWCGKNTSKATTWYMQFLKSYCIHKSFDLGLYWKFKKVSQRSTSNLAEILMRTTLPVKLQHDADTFWVIIIFTRSCKMLPFEHDLVRGQTKVNIELVRDFDVEYRSVKLQHDACNWGVNMFTRQPELE